MVDTLVPPPRTQPPRRPRPRPADEVEKDTLTPPSGARRERDDAPRRAPATSGEILRTARLRRHISLADAEQATRIRLQYLQALEDDDLGALPAGVYSRGFLRNYALFLGVPPEDVLSGMSVRRGREVRERRAALRPTGRPISFRVPRATWLVAAVALVALLVIGGLAWLGLTAPEDQRSAAPGGAPAAAASPTALVQLPPLATPASPTAAPTVAPTTAPSPTARPAGAPVEVELRTTDRSWVRATVDGKMVLEDTLASGQSLRWTGQQSVALRIGNAGGVEVTVNGQRLGALGKPGEAVDREFTR